MIQERRIDGRKPNWVRSACRVIGPALCSGAAVFNNLQDCAHKTTANRSALREKSIQRATQSLVQHAWIWAWSRPGSTWLSSLALWLGVRRKMTSEPPGRWPAMAFPPDSCISSFLSCLDKLSLYIPLRSSIHLSFSYLLCLHSLSIYYGAFPSGLKLEPQSIILSQAIALQPFRLSLHKHLQCLPTLSSSWRKPPATPTWLVSSRPITMSLRWVPVLPFPFFSACQWPFILSSSSGRGRGGALCSPLVPWVSLYFFKNQVESI